MRNTDANAMKNRFRMELANEGYELRKLLSQNDVLDKNILHNCLDTATDHIKVICLKYACESGKYASVEKGTMKTPESDDTLAKAVAAIWGSVGGLFLANMTVATTTTGMWWWKTTTDVSLAAAVGSALGVGAGIATGGIAILLGLGGGYVVSKLTKNFFKEKVISKIMEQYEKEIVPKLLDWFDSELASQENSCSGIERVEYALSN